MTFRILDRAKMSVSGSPGTGNITLGAAVSGYQSFLQAGLQNGDTFAYSVVDGYAWEFGVATFTQLTSTLARAVTKTSNQNTTPLSLSSQAIVTAVLRGEDVNPAAATLSALSDVNVSEGAPIDGYSLVWNNSSSKWIASNVSGGGGGSSTLHALTDVNVTEGSGIDGYTLNWNNSTSKWVATAPVTPGISNVPVQNNGTLVAAATTLNFINATSITNSSGTLTVTLPTGGGGTTLSALTDVSVSEGSGINNYVLYWNNGATKWEAKALATVATSGAYSDLSGTPSLATVATSGSYTDLSSKPTIYSTLATLTDVSVTEGSGIDGYCLYWNNSASKWEAKSVSGGGTSLAGLTTDVLISSPANGQVLTYNGSEWANSAPAAVGFTVGTPPTVVQFAQNSANGADAAVTMGATPTNGNMLVAIIYTDNTTPTAASGWTVQSSVSSGLWYCFILTKTAGASESTSQNPIGSGGGGHWAKGIWEVNGQNGTTPVLFSSASQSSGVATVAQTNIIPQATSTLFLASLAPSQSQTYTLTSIFGIAHTDVNLSGGSGAHAAYGHCDSNNPTYGMLGVLSTSCQFNQAGILITH